MVNSIHMVVSLGSLFFGIGLLITSTWVLYASVNQRYGESYANAVALQRQVNEFFGGASGLYDLDLVYRILIAVSATALISAFLQVITSFILLFSAFTGSKLSQVNRRIARIWVTIQILILTAVIGGLTCILFNQIEFNNYISTFVAFSSIDAIFLIVACHVVFIYSFRQDYSAV